MSSLLKVRAAVMARLSQEFPGLKVKALAGDLSFESLGHKQPGAGNSLYISVLGAVNDPQDGSLDFDLLATFGAAVISRKPVAEVREAEALILAEGICRKIHGQSFGLASPATFKTLEQVSDSDLDKTGVSVWVIIWQQRIN